VLRFCASVYEESSDTIKKRILGLMKRVDNDYYLLFIKNNRIDAGFINSEGHEVNDDMRF